MARFQSGGYPLDGVHTATGGSTTTVVDSSAGLSGATADAFDHYWIKIVTTTDNLAPQGEIRQISEGGYTAASGTFTVSVAFTVAPASGDTYEIHRDFHPNEVDSMANERLRNLWVPAFYPLSVHVPANDDNDMEYTDATPYAGTNATLAKATTPLYGGTRVMSVTATATGGYAAVDANIAVHPSLQYVTAALLSATDGDEGQLVIWDATNSAAIDSSGEATLAAWQELVIQWTPPATCRTVQPRLVSVNDTDVTYWDDYQTWVQGQYDYALPSWITMKEQIIKVIGYPWGQGLVDNEYAAFERRSQPLNWDYAQEEYAGTNEIRIHVDCPASLRPYIIARKPVTEVSYDYGSAGVGAGALGSPANTVPLTSQQTDVVVYGVQAESHRRIAHRYSGEDKRYHEREAIRLENLYKAGLEKLGLNIPVRRYHSDRIGMVIP